MSEGEPLIAPDEPKPYEVVNAGGTAPFLLICDHASRLIPRSLDNLGLSEADLTRHVSYDIGASDLARMLSDILDAPLVLSGYSRLIIDPNRQPGTETSIPKASEDVVVPGNHDLSEEAMIQRRKTFFEPYHQAISDQMRRFSEAGSVPALISIHSFTPAFHGVERPWHVGVLWHLDKRIALPLIKRLRAEPDLCVGDNEPYSGRNPEGYSIDVHAADRGFPNVLIEVRQDLIDSPEGVEEWSHRLAHALREILADRDIYQPWTEYSG